MADDQDDTRGFRVTDRRRFSESGAARAAADAAAPPSAPQSAATPDEPVTFTTFILGLSTQALLHLGDIPNPGTGRR